MSSKVRLTVMLDAHLDGKPVSRTLVSSVDLLSKPTRGLLGVLAFCAHREIDEVAGLWNADVKDRGSSYECSSKQAGGDRR